MASLIAGKCQDINQERIQQDDVGGWKGVGGLPGCSPPKSKLKKPEIVDTATSTVSHGSPFNLNQSLKSADDWYIGILKYKINLGI
jgi:hypothetical protein